MVDDGPRQEVQELGALAPHAGVSAAFVHQLDEVRQVLVAGIVKGLRVSARGQADYRKTSVSPYKEKEPEKRGIYNIIYITLAFYTAGGGHSYMIRRIFMITVMALQALTAGTLLRAQDGSRSSLEAKLALENSLEKRVRMVLSEALGTEDIIVIISAEMQEKDKRSSEIMPGVPQMEKMGQPSLSSSLTMVKKISASLIMDKSVSEADAQLAKKLTAGLLGLPPEREDLVSVEKMDFRKTQPVTLAALLSPPNLWSLIWILIAGTLAVVLFTVFLSPLTKSARAFVEAFSAGSAAAAAGTAHADRAEAEVKTPAAQAAAETRAPQEIEGRKPPFWFLSPAHLASLTFIMRTRPVEDLTIVLSYAPEDFAAKLAEALYPKSAEAMAALPRITLMPEARVRALEAEILSSLDYVVGGEDKALNIISGLGEAVQDKAMAAVGRLDPAMAKKLTSSIVRLANIQAIEPAHAQALARRLPMRVLAAALKGSPYAAIFLSKLAGGMQERFKQELDLTRDLPAEAYKAERAKVVETMRQMIKEGFITLNPHAAHHAPAAAGIKHPAGQNTAAAPAPGAKPAAAAHTAAPAASPEAKPAPASPAAPKP